MFSRDPLLLWSVTTLPEWAYGAITFMTIISADLLRILMDICTFKEKELDVADILWSCRDHWRLQELMIEVTPPQRTSGAYDPVGVTDDFRSSWSWWCRHWQLQELMILLVSGKNSVFYDVHCSSEAFKYYIVLDKVTGLTYPRQTSGSRILAH